MANMVSNFATHKGRLTARLSSKAGGIDFIARIAFMPASLL
jgi:hypothetical protein